MPRNDSLGEGPGAVTDEQIQPKPLLEDATEYEFVEILNPMSVVFTGQFGMTRPVHAPLTVKSFDRTRPNEMMSESEFKAFGGFDLRGPDHQSKAAITQSVPIKPGQTVKLLGSEAKVIVKQLVDAMMQRQGKTAQLANGTIRRQLEEQIVLQRNSIRDTFNMVPKTAKQQLQETLDKENTYEPEEAFPTLKETGSDVQGGTSLPPTGNRGRKKSA